MMELTEADVKRGVEEYLQYQQNLGKLWFCRLNAGDFIEVRGETRRRIKGAPKGTADFIVIQYGTIQMYYKAISRWEPWPVAFVTFIECKSTKGKQSPEQLEFEVMIARHNCRYYIVRSVDDLITALGRE